MKFNITQIPRSHGALTNPMSFCITINNRKNVKTSQSYRKQRNDLARDFSSVART